MAELFNYIAFGNRDLVAESSQGIEMSRGRMFEYTPADIAKRLEDLGQDSLGFLEKLPTFLCSEISRTGRAVSLLVKFGTLRRIRVTKKDVVASFSELVDFGEVQFEGIDHAQKLFEFDGYQLYRTHWAVRIGDARTFLRRLVERKPRLEALVREHLQSDEFDPATEPPPRTKKVIGTANSVKGFLEILYGQKPRSSAELFFRGHNDEKFELTPSLFRKTPGGAWRFLPEEESLCKELLIAHYDEFQGDHYCFDRLVRMQHYGLPTRLLDITSNPLVALFFACYGAPDEAACNGEVIVFWVSPKTIKYYDSDTVSCLANLSALNNELKNKLNLSMSLVDFNRTASAKKLLYHIQSEKSFFQKRISPEDLGSIVCVKAKRTNSRIKSQSGAFLLFGHDATLPEGGQKGIEVARIIIKNKEHILKELDTININVMSVYPSIDHTAVHLRDRYAIREK